MILAIDPGTTESAYVMLSEYLRPVQFEKAYNEEVVRIVYEASAPDTLIVIEEIASYGMPVGKEVFSTVRWTGRFEEAARSGGSDVTFIERRVVKLHLCHDSRAKDSNISQALRDRFGDKGTKKAPGWFYGFYKDIWQAYALGVTFAETVQVAPRA